MNVSEAQLLAWLQQYFLPFVRIGGLLLAAPVLGARQVPARVRVALAVILTILVAPQLEPGAVLAPFAAGWWLAVAQQLVIGIAIGLALLIVFEAVTLGGELIAGSMGLGFAQMADPLRGTPSPVTGQFLAIIATLSFLATQGHLVLLELLVQSFRSAPAGGLGPEPALALARLGSDLFAGGVRLALPLMIALLVVNLAFGVVSRAAPTLNLLAVGFPVSLIAGLVLLAAALPILQSTFLALLAAAWETIGRLIEAPRG